MSKISETGHAVNVANMVQLNAYVITFGADYNPSKESIKSPALQLLTTNAQAANNTVNAALSTYTSAVEERKTAFKPIGALSSRVLSALKASDSTELTDENAHTLVRKIKGERATPITPATNAALPAEEQKKQISASQMGFTNRIDNLDKYINLLENTPEYAPNEIELKVVTLKTLKSKLISIDNTALNADIALSTARLERNQILYKTDTGLVDTAQSVKNYIKSLYGITSPQFKQVSNLTFRKQK